jgi:hypothetical protein
MFKEKENKWTRPRGFWSTRGPDIGVMLISSFFLLMSIGGIAFVILEPRVKGLHELFSDPTPAAAAPAPDRALHLAPGETEMKLFTVPAKPAEKKK